jgi:hypothetical protein
MKVPVTGSGAAQSLRPVSVLADGQRENFVDGVVCGIRTRVAGMFCEAAAKPKSGVLGLLDEHDVVAEISTSAVSMRESSRRMRCLAAREPGPARAHPDTAHTLRFAAKECMGTPEVERQGETSSQRRSAPCSQF